MFLSNLHFHKMSNGFVDELEEIDILQIFMQKLYH